MKKGLRNTDLIEQIKNITEKHNLWKLTQKKKEHLNSLISIKEFEFIVKKPLYTENLRPSDIHSLVNSDLFSFSLRSL